MPQAILKPRKARPFYGRHPWVLDSAIDRVEGEPADGDVVDLVSDKGKFIARGVFNSRSRIRVRLYTWDPTEILDEPFWRRRLESAIGFRSQLGYDDPQGAARLVFSEGDALSGLIVDRYANYLAVQVTAQAIAVRLPTIVPMLVELTQPRGIMIRTERGVSRAEGIELRDGPYWGTPPDGPLVIVENGLKYELDLAEGQKTGYYLDQRDNRVAAARYFRDRRVLDMFCYSGGFSLTASALGGAREVLGVDTSQKAVTLAWSNAERNGVKNVRFQCGDGFQTLESLLEAGERFGAVVLDPPKFARTRGALDEALRAYHWLNRLGVGLLEPGGILVTCSCSGHVSREDFLYMLVGVAQQTGRQIQLLEQRGAAADHPISASCLESEYLKCFICRVV
ncbi:MAG: class I SAM-dependent rRNA methyltransferase [Planctomycetaceae bacterium]|nr:class I SAM-dependent rRNA methyltransferase [Planctomycetaceae bacterium]